MKINDLKKGDIMSNDDLIQLFGCDNSKGIRYVKEYNHIVLISNHTSDIINNPYQDKWEEGLLYYTGEGKAGDQKLEKANLRLLKSKNKRTKIYYFEVFEPSKYTYFGQLKLADTKPIESTQKDVENNDRRVIVFKLKEVV